MTHVEQMPIFVLGMLQRTGTNHLWDLLGLHPDTELLVPVYEDHLVRCSDHLVDYVSEVTRYWTPDWDVPAEESSALLASLGYGITRWLQGDSDRRMVTKMPSVERADRFFELFPDCPLVLLVRDGRSVSESGVSSFGWSYERAFRRWATAADIVLGVLDQHAGNSNLVLVRYEQLIDDPVASMRALCSGVGLDADRYPYHLIDELPVRGSSTLRSQGANQIHWGPTEKSASFDPRERWRTWDAHRHRRFAEVAGRQQRALGYDLVDAESTTSPSEWIADRRDLVDARYRETRVRLGRVRRAVVRSWTGG
jgi:hypothetical protein